MSSPARWHGLCNATWAKRLHWCGALRAKFRARLAKMSAATAVLRPTAALFAPRRVLTMPGGPLEPKPDSGHIDARGDGEKAATDLRGLEAKGKMRSFLVAFAAFTLFASGAAQAKVAITVDKNNQQMTVAVDGVERYHWPVSTGIPSRETPNGNFRAFRMEARPLLQGIRRRADAAFDLLHEDRPRHSRHRFRSRLGSPASHGCVRLSRDHATKLYALVQQEGVLNTTVTLTGSSQVALARNPRRANKAVARRAPPPQYEQQQYGAAGDPVVITPQQQRQAAGGRVPMMAISIRPMALRRSALSGTAQPPRLRYPSLSAATQQQYYGQSRLCAGAAGLLLSATAFFQPRGLFSYQN